MDYSNALERRNIILDKLKNSGQVFVNELADDFNVSQETIRRDLNKLEELKHIKKIHGGAVIAQFGFELEFNQRAKLAEDDKKAIAIKAAELIKPGDSLFIDFGTTTLEFAKQIAGINQLTVITNSPVIANLFLQIPALHLAISALFILFSAGAILWETSNIIHGGETNYIRATVSLYVSLYNMFISLLSILGFARSN